MALKKPEPKTKLSLEIPATLKARIEAVATAASAAGFEFDYVPGLIAALEKQIERDERVLGIGATV